MDNSVKAFFKKYKTFLFYISIILCKFDVSVLLKFWIRITMLRKNKSLIYNFNSNFNDNPIKNTELIYSDPGCLKKNNTENIKRVLKNKIFVFSPNKSPFKNIYVLLNKIKCVILKFRKILIFLFQEKCRFLLKINYFRFHLLKKFVFEQNKPLTFNLSDLERAKKETYYSHNKLKVFRIPIFGIKLYDFNEQNYRFFKIVHRDNIWSLRRQEFGSYKAFTNDFWLKEKKKKVFNCFCDLNFSSPNEWTFYHEIFIGKDFQSEKNKITTKCPTGNRMEKKIPGKNFLNINNVIYLKLEMIGKGGSGKVYKIIRKDNKIFALKKNKIGQKGVEMINNFINEITILKFLSGKSRIIQIQDAQINFKKKLIFIILEFGEFDLELLITKKRNSVMSSNIKWYWKEILETVKEIHEERIVHGDLKPSNFLFVKHSLKLIDFGISKTIKNNTTNITRDIHVGTLNYMSPEAILEIPGVLEEVPMIKTSRASDIWSLGCILFQLSQGYSPYKEFSMIQKINSIVNNSLQIKYLSSVDQFLFDVIHNCLKRNPDSRPNISELLIHPYLKIRK